MTRVAEEPNAFLWVLRGLTSLFLVGYLAFLYFTIIIYELFPSGEITDNILAIGLLLLFGMGYYLIWKRREGLSGILFILWYAALWPIEILAEGALFEKITAPGILVLILGILLLTYRIGIIKRQRAGEVTDE